MVMSELSGEEDINGHELRKRPRGTPIKQVLLYMGLSIDITDGCGISNKAHCGYLNDTINLPLSDEF